MKYQKCKKCKMEIPKKAKVCHHCGANQGMGCGTAIVILVFLVLLLSIPFMANKGDKSSSSDKPATSAATQSNNDKKDLLFQDVQCVTKTSGGISSTTVSGYCINNTNKTFDYLDITVGFYDENGVRVSVGMANTLNFEPGEKWFFTVIDLTPGIKHYKIEEASNLNW